MKNPSDEENIISSSKASSSWRNHISISRIGLVFVGSLVAVSCFLSYKSAYHFQFLPTSFRSSSSPAPVSPEKLDVELEKVLRAASMEDNKTVILTTLNDAWAEPGSVIDVFLESFRIGNNTNGLLTHLVIVTLDEKAHSRCLAIHPHCYALVTRGLNFTQEAFFMTPTYLEMMWARIEFLATVLEMGYSFIFTDADVMWLQNPFPHFYPDADFQIACDNYWGNSSDRNNMPNGGFNYVKSNTPTIQFYKFWYFSRTQYPGKHDQDVLNMIKFDPFIDKIGLQMRFLDTAYFGGFCEPSKNFNLVCTMHANCCFGLEHKVYDLKLVLEDWRRFMLSPPNVKASSSFSWRAPDKCRLR